MQVTIRAMWETDDMDSGMCRCRVCHTCHNLLL